jgi:low temperature requirement protein LtrA
VLVFALWWLYFLHPCGLARHRERSYRWGYGQYGIVAALAALGAGLEAAARHAGDKPAGAPLAVGYAVAIPVAAFLVLLWLVNRPIVDRLAVRPAVTMGAASAVLVLPVAAPVVGSAVILAAIAAIGTAVIATTLLWRVRGAGEGSAAV